MNFYNKEMKRILFLTAALMLTQVLHVNAQDQDNLDKLTAYKIAFFTQRLNLSPAEAEKFWPLYNDFSARKSKIQTERIGLIRYASQNEANMSEKELSETADRLANTFSDEANLIVTFNSEMQKVLPPAKVIRLYQIENQYKQQLLRQLNERRQAQGAGQRLNQLRDN